jgi:hypothetical protein
MALNSTVEEVFVCALGSRRTNDEQRDPTRRPSWASPEEALRLLRDFLRIETPDLRQEIFKFVAEMLRVQEGR